MALLDRLIRDARKSMQARGHEPMPAMRNKIDATAIIYCKHCNQRADVICKPLPNEIQIGGEAVALNCNVATKYHDAMKATDDLKDWRKDEITKKQFAKVLDTVPSDNISSIRNWPLWRFEESDFIIYAVQGC